MRLPSGARYWTVIDENLTVVAEADEFLRHVRFGRDGSELTTRAYAGSLALYLRWCRRTGRSWQAGVEHLGLFLTWLRHAPPEVSGADAIRDGSAEVLAGPGRGPVRGARRVNAVLTAVRAFVSHAMTTGRAPGSLLPLIYELAVVCGLRTSLTISAHHWVDKLRRCWTCPRLSGRGSWLSTG